MMFIRNPGDVYVTGLDFIDTQCLLDFRIRGKLQYQIDQSLHFTVRELRLRNAKRSPPGYTVSEICLLILLSFYFSC